MIIVKGSDEMTELYTVKEAAQYLKISVRQVYNLIKSGHIQIVKIGKSTRIRDKELKRFTDGL